MRRKTKSVGYNNFTMPSPGGLVAFVIVLIFLYLFFYDQNYFNKESTSIKPDYTGYSGQYPDVINVARVLSVYDGDTLRVDAVEIQAEENKGVRIRLRGIDAPEIEGSCDEEKTRAIASRDWLIQVVSNASQMQLVDIGYDEDPYGRIIAHVLLDGVNISNLSIAEGHSIRWEGKRNANWCV